jgi:hypothetical protein
MATISRRCSICAANWPDEKDYQPCPECGEQTDRISEIIPMDADEARSRKRLAEFEAFMEKWDATHDPARLVSSE